ncbi:hypothetical protein BZG35_14085 [Brevundimonas sp. LM2]|uniref:hypothetical protein n=1 Tax=Brevundimonas sp. LM2 TaxID=1938605 RepID=UPI000983B252|nr:hypothetical protein [Brevundimonas sp. LM2]AQR62651.1 hypothetical protein BZG35_14085 [Brevundimonas sp. LM2]
MAGKGDEARGAVAVQAAWVEARLQDLRSMIDGAFSAVAAWPVPEGDLTAIDKKTRAITNLARAVAAVESAARRLMAAVGCEGDSAEDEMNDGDRPDPETVERYKAELLDRLEHNHALVEAKRLAADARDGGGVETALPR